MIFARAHDPGRAESLWDTLVPLVQKASGWHAWKWDLRLCHARAELSLARGGWAEAVVAASHVVAQSRLRHRPKYEALGLIARARARHHLGVRQAVDDARSAAHGARSLGDPTVLLECLGVLLELDGSDAVLVEARDTAAAILSGLSQVSLRCSFRTALSSKFAGVLS